MFYREIPLPGTVLENDVVTYAATWNGKERRTSSAIFATSIYGNVGKDLYEESQFSFQDRGTTSPAVGNTLFNNIPFAITDDITTPPVLAMSRFAEVSQKSSLLYNCRAAFHIVFFFL